MRGPMWSCPRPDRCGILIWQRRLKNSTRMDEQLKACAQRAIGEKVFPGCVIGYVRRDGTRTILPLGNYKYVTSSAVKARTIYDLASITKSIPLASLALTFIAEGKLSQGDPVKKYLPELQHDHGATIEDLLR